MFYLGHIRPDKSKWEHYLSRQVALSFPTGDSGSILGASTLFRGDPREMTDTSYIAPLVHSRRYAAASEERTLPLRWTGEEHQLAQSITLRIFDRGTPLPFTVACQISRLFRLQYGDNYHTDLLEDPSSISAKVSNGEWIGFVLENEHGELCAHSALLSDGSRSFKFGRSVVHPDYRGLGYADLLTDARTLYAKRIGISRVIDTLSTDAVTAHPISQKLFVRRNFRPSALLIGKLTDYFGKGTRESVVVLTKIQNPAVREERTVHVPECYASIARYLYLQHGCKRSFVTDPGEVVVGDVVPYVDRRSIDMGTVIVSGGGGAPLLNLVERSHTMPYIAVKLPLTDPGTLHTASQLRDRGFLFGGIEFAVGGDLLILQRSSTIDTARSLELYSEAAKKILHSICTTAK
jgi:GNAT superfamily N-acetyltransferase